MILPLADAGVPMISVQMPAMLFALVPIIILEALLLQRWLSLTYRSAFSGSILANLVSTIAGVPLAWALMLSIEMCVLFPISRVALDWGWKMDSPVLGVLGFLLGIAWLGPVGRNYYFMIPLASALLLIPSFFISVYLEQRICLPWWRSSDPVMVRRAVLRANQTSYALLFLIACAWSAFELWWNK